MSYFTKAITAVLITGALACPIWAEPVGNSFTYQGRLNVSGAPATVAQGFEFALYDAASGGAQVGTTNAFPAVAITHGLFTVPLDFGAAAFGSEARFLEVRVKPAASADPYTTLAPRQPITPAPVALVAQTVPDGSLTRSKISDDFNPVYAATGYLWQYFSGTTPYPVGFSNNTQAKGFIPDWQGCTAVHNGLYAVSTQLTAHPYYTTSSDTAQVHFYVNGVQRDAPATLQGQSNVNQTWWADLVAGDQVQIRVSVNPGSSFYFDLSDTVPPSLKVVRVD